MQQLYCIAACIDNMTAMLYATNMDTIEIEAMIYNFVSFVRANRAMEFSQPHTTSESFEIELDEIDVKMSIKITFGLVNSSDTTITHSDYNIKYLRVWPDWNTQFKADRISGSHVYQFKGNMDLFKQHFLFIKLASA